MQEWKNKAQAMPVPSKPDMLDMHKFYTIIRVANRMRLRAATATACQKLMNECMTDMCALNSILCNTSLRVGRNSKQH